MLESLATFDDIPSTGVCSNTVKELLHHILVELLHHGRRGSDS